MKCPKQMLSVIFVLALASTSYAVTGDVSIEGRLDVTGNAKIGAAGASIDATAGRFYGSFTGDGAQLINVPSSLADYAVTETKIATGAVTAPKFGATPLPVSGQFLKYSGSSITWETVSAGTGTVTKIYPGAGISATQNPITTSGTLSVIASSFSASTIASRGAIDAAVGASTIEVTSKLLVYSPSATSSAVSVNGTIESQTSGGFKFPDGSLQTVAVTMETKVIYIDKPYATREAYAFLPHNAMITKLAGYVDGGTSCFIEFRNNGNLLLGWLQSAGTTFRFDPNPFANASYSAYNPLLVSTLVVNGAVRSVTAVIEYTRR